MAGDRGESFPKCEAVAVDGMPQRGRNRRTSGGINGNYGLHVGEIRLHWTAVNRVRNQHPLGEGPVIARTCREGAASSLGERRLRGDGDCGRKNGRSSWASLPSPTWIAEGGRQGALTP